ncbi:calnexin-like isoform X2 [Styela clava]
MVVIKFGLVFLLILFSGFGLNMAEDDDEAEVVVEEAVEEPESTITKYEKPVPKGHVNFAEPFDKADSINGWKISEAKKDGVDEEISKYNGRWEVVQPITPLLDGDLGLVLKDKARHHAISVDLSKPYEFDGEPFVMQYEVNFQNGIECGGGYVKLLSKTEDVTLKTFNDKTPYTIMFGPDKCGEDYKLHFIFRHKNPKTGEYEEKHAKKTTADLKSAYTDKAFHLYTLVVNPDNTFKMYLDQKEINSGSLLEDMTPAVNPPKEIEDKDDKKPEEWDERERIPDPEATKPDDWNEDAPAQIPDPDAEMPEGWLENEPQYADDPDAVKPEDWDNEMDGEWEAPKIENPKCKEAPGCGTWEPPLIANPEFKGKWRAPMIANPAYKGIWKPRQIPNPDYFEDLQPYKMTPIGAIGLELWSMSDKIMFDNFIMTNDKAVADDYAMQTWKQKKIAHARNEPAAGIFQQIMDATEGRPWLWAVYIGAIGLPLVMLYTFCCSGQKKSDPKKTDEPTPDDPHDSQDEETKEGDEDQPEEQDSAKEEEPEQAPEDASGDAKKKPSKTDLEEDEEQEEEPAEQTTNRRSPRRKARKD